MKILIIIFLFLIIGIRIGRIGRKEGNPTKVGRIKDGYYRVIWESEWKWGWDTPNKKFVLVETENYAVIFCSLTEYDVAYPLGSIRTPVFYLNNVLKRCFLLFLFSVAVFA